MFKSYKNILIVLATTTGIVFTSATEGNARISPLLFKSVSRNFSDPHYSPTLGMIALDTGIIPNLRFYGNFTPAFLENGQRDFGHDDSSDSLWKVVFLLFPSSGGSINVQMQRDDSFGKAVSSPKTIALLLDFVHKLRKKNDQPEVQPDDGQAIGISEKGSKSKGATAKIKGDSNIVGNQLFSQLPALKGGRPKNVAKPVAQADIKNITATNIFQSFEKKNQRSALKGEKGTVKRLLNFLEDAVNQEKKGFYPKYTVEQILLAFFGEKFNTREDIIDLIKFLHEINPEIVPTLDGLQNIKKWEKEELNNLVFKEKKDFDDVYALYNKDIFYSVTPYKPNISLLSNGDAKVYDRERDAFFISKTFADCVETSIRHLLNLALYKNREGLRYFDLSAWKGTEVDENIRNLLDFYSYQKDVDFANAGDIKTRSNWNSVVGDLNHSISRPSIQINYVKKHNNIDYEIETGFINLVNVLRKLFFLKLSENERELEELDVQKATQDVQFKWVSSYLKAFFMKFNPNRLYEIEQSGELKYDYIGEKSKNIKDLFGKIVITIQETDQPSFSFEIKTDAGHSEVKNLHIHPIEKAIVSSNLVVQGEGEVEEYPAEESSQLTDADKAINQLSEKMIQNGTLNSILLLRSKEEGGADFGEVNKLSSFYQIFSAPLSDNDQRIDALRRIIKSDGYHSHLDNTISNILKDMSWSDEVIIEQFSRFYVDECLDLIDTEKEQYLTQISKNIKSIIFDKRYAPEFIEKFIKDFDSLEYLDLSQVGDYGDRYISKLKNPRILKTLKISDMGKVENFNQFSALETLWVIRWKSPEISLAGLGKLQYLTMAGGKVSKINDLNHCYDLKKLDLKLANLKELSTKGLANLKEIELLGGDFSKIDDLDKAESLEYLHLEGLHKPFELSLKGLKNINKLKIVGGNLSKIIDIDGAESLKHIWLSYVRFPTPYVLNVDSLKFLNDIQIDNSNVTVEKSQSTSMEGLQGGQNINE